MLLQSIRAASRLRSGATGPADGRRLRFTLKWGTPFHTAKAAGWDFNILRLGLALAIALMGPGEWTL